jgi:hypothetical protein
MKAGFEVKEFISKYCALKYHTVLHSRNAKGSTQTIVVRVTGQDAFSSGRGNRSNVQNNGFNYDIFIHVYCVL